MGRRNVKEDRLTLSSSLTALELPATLRVVFFAGALASGAAVGVASFEAVERAFLVLREVVAGGTESSMGSALTFVVVVRVRCEG